MPTDLNVDTHSMTVSFFCDVARMGIHSSSLDFDAIISYIKVSFM